GPNLAHPSLAESDEEGIVVQCARGRTTERHLGESFYSNLVVYSKNSRPTSPNTKSTTTLIFITQVPSWVVPAHSVSYVALQLRAPGPPQRLFPHSAHSGHTTPHPPPGLLVEK